MIFYSWYLLFILISTESPSSISFNNSNTNSCDSTRIHLSLAINSPEHTWLLQNEDKCNVINQFLKTINFEESGKLFIKSYIKSSLQEEFSDLEEVIEFYYEVFKPERYYKPFDQQLWLAQTKNE